MSDYGRNSGDITYSRSKDRDRNDRSGDRSAYYSSSKDKDSSTSIFGWDERGDRSDRSRGRSAWGDNDKSYDRDRSRSEYRSSYGRSEEGRRYGSDDYHEGLPMDETSRLIASNKVEGTTVYGREGSKIGTIYNFMVDKYSGRVEYAVLSYGGFLGMGERYAAIPWKMLDYDTREGGYHIDMTERELKDAPSFDRDSEPRFDDKYGDRVHGYYGTRR